MATLVPKPKSLFLYHISKNKKLLFLIGLAILLVTGVTIGAVALHKELKQIRRLRHDLSATQFTVSQYRRQVSQLSPDDDLRISKLQQAWTGIESKLRNQEEQIRKLGHLLPQQSLHPDMREANLLQELQVHKDMYIQAQQKIRSYEQQLLALTHEMKDLKEQNQLIRQDQIKIRAEHQELLNQKSQVSQEQPLKKPLESRLSQLVNADYELDQKLRDVQKTMESCVKIGELKALEVYYDDKLENLTRVIQKTNNNNLKNSSDNEQLKQLKQDLIKLAQEEEEMKAAFHKLDEHQKDNENRLKALEKQENLNVISARPVDTPPLSPQKALEEAVKNYNVLSKSGQNKKELKEAKKHIKELNRQINQQPQEVYQKVQQDAPKQKRHEGNEKGKVQIEEIFDQAPFERELGNDLANIINAFVDLYNDL